LFCSSRNDSNGWGRYLLVEKTNPYGERKGDFLVALDIIGAGYDELVLVTEGSPSLGNPGNSEQTDGSLIVGIVDQVDENERLFTGNNEE